jgi:CubicO group peptidase (beta-lactamase class C family)
MTRTTADHVARVIPDRARPYEKMGPAFVNAPFVDNSVKWAGGGFLSTPEDLLRLGAYVTSDTLGAASRALLFTEQTTASGEVVGYGFGWRLGRDARGRRTVSHSGGAVGGSSLLVVVPEAGVVVAAAINLTRADLGWITDIAEALSDATDPD